MTWKERFLRFLKEEGVYGEWVYNIYEQHPIWDNSFWESRWKNERLSEQKQCKEGIISAFCWGRTKQGNDFWSKIDDEWIDKCRNSFYKIWFGKKNF